MKTVDQQAIGSYNTRTGSTSIFNHMKLQNDYGMTNIDLYVSPRTIIKPDDELVQDHFKLCEILNGIDDADLTLKDDDSINVKALKCFIDATNKRILELDEALKQHRDACELLYEVYKCLLESRNYVGDEKTIQSVICNEALNKAIDVIDDSKLAQLFSHQPSQEAFD